MVVEAIMLTLLLANSYRLVSEALESQTRVRLEALAPLLDASLAGRVFQRDHSEINAIIQQLVGSKLTEISYIVVFDRHDEVLASAGKSTPELLANTAPVDQRSDRQPLSDIDLRHRSAAHRAGQHGGHERASVCRSSSWCHCAATFCNRACGSLSARFCCRCCCLPAAAT